MGSEERELLAEAFDSNWIAPLGPHVDAFEREFAAFHEVDGAVALSSGTAALHLALLLSGVEPGDEVVSSSLTFVATANAIRYVGATPVFIDSDRTSWNLDPVLLEAFLEQRAAEGTLPAAVVAVDLYGQTADYERIAGSCAKYGLPLIEDAAEALGATYTERPAGTFGDFGVFSFNGNKIITTSGGGMLVARSNEHLAKARFLATQGRDPAPHYQHSEIGFNYRLSNLLAAVGRGQLRLLESRVDRRRYNNQRYRELLADLPGIVFMPEAPRCRSTFWLTCITVDPEALGATREDLRLALEAEDIEARPVWKPMHMQPLYVDCEMHGGAVAADLFERGLCLPSGTALSDDDLARIAAVIRSVVG
jgi:pyridoxal phosphate-dependent aminotransferase EpsN